ncbi:Retrovirus-related Pol polyprotein from transposon RE1 [Fagus crenata]
MAAENNFVQPAIPKFDGHYDHWSMLMENFLRSKEYWSLVETGVPAAEGVELTEAQQKSIADQKLKDLKSSLLVHEQRMNGHGGDEQALKVTYDDRTGGRGGG